MHKPWFDRSCIKLRKAVIAALRVLRRPDHTAENQREYAQLAKEYELLKNSKKKEYFLSITEKFASVRNPQEFWSAVKSCKPRLYMPEVITVAEWSDFLREVYPSRPSSGLSFQGPSDGRTDGPFSLFELTSCLASLKPGKAPGIDSISNDFFKALPDEWIQYLLALFNKILCTESIPQDWGKIILFMLHKKGPTSDPFNYRGIALINSCVKIFTKILQTRLYNWAISLGLLPEEQGGFMEGKGTTDNIFVLQTAIHLRLRHRGGRVYAMFVDFKRAFDSIPHDKLWAFLYNTGFSPKLLRILSAFYSQVTLQVRSNSGLSEQADVSEGVLQGEILSPLLFILYLGDITEFFRSRGVSGISLNHTTDLLLLLYADDLVLLAQSPAALKEMMTVLQEYCNIKGLSVNTQKTKIVVFRKGGPVPTSVENLPLNGHPIEVVDSYSYLGVTFSSSSLGVLPTKETRRKAKIAMGSVFSILSAARADAWSSTLKLYDCLITSVLMYSAHIFGLRYLQILERAQLAFFKLLFHLPECTPGFALRLELGLSSIAVTLTKMCINWIIKILKMSTDRLPKICYMRLLQLKDSPLCPVPFNWISQLQSITGGLIPEDLWHSSDWTVWEGRKYVILNELAANLRLSDLTRYNRTAALQLKIPRNTSDNYLVFYPERCPIHLVRTIMQLRLASVFSKRFIIKKSLFIQDSSLICDRCRIGELDTFRHVLCNCSLYSNIREHYILPWCKDGQSQEENLCALLNSKDVRCYKDIYLFLLAVFDARSRIVH